MAGKTIGKGDLGKSGLERVKTEAETMAEGAGFRVLLD